VVDSAETEQLLAVQLYYDSRSNILTPYAHLHMQELLNKSVEDTAETEQLLALQQESEKRENAFVREQGEGRVRERTLVRARDALQLERDTLQQERDTLRSGMFFVFCFLLVLVTGVSICLSVCTSVCTSVCIHMRMACKSN